jgi:very-short-patch-repair endonuclease
MTIVETMWSLGGIAQWSELRRIHSQYALEQSLQRGSIVRTKRRGLYCLPERLTRGKVRAVGGVVSHISAAEVWELGVLEPPPSLHITVRRSRHNVDKPDNVEVHYSDLAPDQIHGEVTSVRRTVIDCARTCTFAQALAIADTAIRVGHVTQSELHHAAAAIRGPGAVQVRRVARFADSRAMSPAESALRAILIDGGITGFEPQFRARRDGRWIATVDLGDSKARVLLEADSFFWHGQRAALERDARRYNELVAAGYRVLRFTWEHIVGEPDWVLQIVRDVLTRDRPPELREDQRRTA